MKRVFRAGDILKEKTTRRNKGRLVLDLILLLEKRPDDTWTVFSFYLKRIDYSGSLERFRHLTLQEKGDEISPGSQKRVKSRKSNRRREVQG